MTAMHINMFLQKVTYVTTAISMFVILIIICILVINKLSYKANKPSCFGKPLCYHNRAENGCEDCPFEAQCEAARKESSNEDN